MTSTCSAFQNNKLDEMTLTFRIDVMDTVRKVQKWATTASNAIDSEDGRLVEQVD